MPNSLYHPDPLSPDHVSLILKITGAHLDVSTRGSDEPNMWLAAETDGRYFLNLGDGRIETVGGVSPNCYARIAFDQREEPMPRLYVDRREDEPHLDIRCTGDNTFLEELASAIRSGNIPAYANFELSLNPYISRLGWEESPPSTDWKNWKSAPLTLHEQGFSYKSLGTLEEATRTAQSEELSSLHNKISSLDNQLASMKEDSLAWRERVALNFKAILIALVSIAIVFGFFT
jgi:hypothetical protein